MVTHGLTVTLRRLSLSNKPVIQRSVMSQEAFIVYDVRAKNLIPGSPFPSREAAEEHADRYAEGQPEGLAPIYQVLAVQG